jgi:ligand-binding SRPBCC domain-containing protein
MVKTVFEKRSLLRTTVEKLKTFHQDPAAFSKLAPPPIFAQIHRDERTSLTEGELEFTLWFGVFPVRWLARHEPGPTADSFADLMLRGPLSYWRHEHIFQKSGDGAVLIDRVTLEHKPGIAGLVTRLMFDGLPLRFLFFYRHLATRRAVED